MNFEDALSNPIPLAEAAAFFVMLKTAAVPPPSDETGGLEGQFAAPVEEVLKLMGEMVETELATMYAYKAYSNSLRDLSHFGIAKELEEHADGELEHVDFLLRRMAVLGGPITLNDIPAPPATSDANVILDTLIQMEQEGIEKWQALHAMLGDNPAVYKVEEYLAEEQEHLDELWQLRPHQTVQAVAAPPEPMGAPPMGALEQAPVAGPKLANMMPVEMPALPSTAKGQNLIPTPAPALPPAAQGQHQKLALALKGFSDGQRQTFSQGLEKLEQGLASKKVGVLRQAAPDLKALAERPSYRMKVGSAFKLALEQTGIVPPGVPVEARPADPMQQYMEQEQAGQAGQEQNELAFYRERMQQAMQELEAQKAQGEETQQQLAQVQQQVEQAQAQQGQYQQMVSQATQSAVGAKDEVLREQQASAAMRMAYQKLRGDMLNAASQEPPSTEMLAEQAAMTASPPPAGGDPAAAGAAPPGQDPAAAAGAAPPQAEAPPAAPPAAGQDPAMAAASPAAQPAPQPAPQKTASMSQEVKKRLPYAVGGALLGGGAEMAYQRVSVAPLHEKVKRLEAIKEKDRSFGQSVNLAQAKARLAVAEVAERHPKAALLSGMALGGLEGATSGREIVQNFREGGRNLKQLGRK